MAFLFYLLIKHVPQLQDAVRDLQAVATTGPSPRLWQTRCRLTSCTVTLDQRMPKACIARVSDVFGQSYHWSLMQVEYATDLAFRSAATLGTL